MARLDLRWRDGEGIGYNHWGPDSTRLCCSRTIPDGELCNSINMAHKARKSRVIKVLTGPAMRPTRETASKIYIILWKRFFFVTFSV